MMKRVVNPWRWWRSATCQVATDQTSHTRPRRLRDGCPSLAETIKTISRETANTYLNGGCRRVVQLLPFGRDDGDNIRLRRMTMRSRDQVSSKSKLREFEPGGIFGRPRPWNFGPVFPTVLFRRFWKPRRVGPRTPPRSSSRKRSAAREWPRPGHAMMADLGAKRQCAALVCFALWPVGAGVVCLPQRQRGAIVGGEWIWVRAFE